MATCNTRSLDASGASPFIPHIFTEHPRVPQAVLGVRLRRESKTQTAEQTLISVGHARAKNEDSGAGDRDQMVRLSF